MFELKRLLTAMLQPPFNVLLLGALAFVLSRLKWRKTACWVSAFSLLLLYFLSIPISAQWLKDSLTENDQLTLADYRQAQAIVVLGGGLRDSQELYAPLASTAVQLERLRYAAYLQKETQLPLLVTGRSPTGAIEAEVAARELKDFFNVPTRWIEPQALTTKENAAYTKAILEKAGIHKIILVTNEWHMQRAKLLFQQQGFEVLPASVGEGKTPENYGLNLFHFVPQAGAMAKNTQLIKEWLGYWKEK